MHSVRQLLCSFAMLRMRLLGRACSHSPHPHPHPHPPHPAQPPPPHAPPPPQPPPHAPTTVPGVQRAERQGVGCFASFAHAVRCCSILAASTPAGPPQNAAPAAATTLPCMDPYQGSTPLGTCMPKRANVLLARSASAGCAAGLGKAAFMQVLHAQAVVKQADTHQQWHSSTMAGDVLGMLTTTQHGRLSQDRPRTARGMHVATGAFHMVTESFLCMPEGAGHVGSPTCALLRACS